MVRSFSSQKMAWNAPQHHSNQYGLVIFFSSLFNGCAGRKGQTKSAYAVLVYCYYHNSYSNNNNNNNNDSIILYHIIYYVIRNYITKTAHRCTTMMYNKPYRVDLYDGAIKWKEEKRKSSRSPEIQLCSVLLDTLYCINVEKSPLCYICYVRDVRVVVWVIETFKTARQY